MIGQNRRRVMGNGLPPDVIMTTKTNAPVLAICYAQGWCASPKYMTATEAAAVTSIGTAFRGKNITHFEEFQYFTGVTSLVSNAFHTCSNLSSLTLPNSLVSIADRVFYGCKKLLYLDIPASCTSINNTYNFYAMGSTLTINFNNTSTIYERMSAHASPTCFTSSLTGGAQDGMLVTDTTLVACPQRKTNIVIPSNITTIGRYCFYQNKSKQSLIIPDTVTTIQPTPTSGTDGAFRSAYFTSIIFSKNIHNIPQRNLYGLSYLEYLVFPMTSLTISNTYNFSGLSALKIVWVTPEIKSLITSNVASTVQVKEIPSDWDGTLEDLLSREE